MQARQADRPHLRHGSDPVAGRRVREARPRREDRQSIIERVFHSVPRIRRPVRVRQVHDGQVAHGSGRREVRTAGHAEDERQVRRMESRGKHRLQLVRHADGIDHVQVREMPQEEIRRRRLRQIGRQGSRLHHQFLPRAGVREDHPVRQDRQRSEIPEIVAGRRDQLRGDREPHGQRGSRDGSHRVHLRSHHVRGAQHEIRLLPELRLRRRDEAGREHGMVLPELRLQRSLQAQHRAKNLWINQTNRST